MNAKIFKPDATDLASRTTGGRLREEIQSAADSGQYVVIDLQDVLSISESYADEAFGVLAAKRGLDWLGGSVQICARHSVLTSIAEAIRERLESDCSPSIPNIHALVAARRRRSAVDA